MWKLVNRVIEKFIFNCPITKFFNCLIEFLRNVFPDVFVLRLR